MTDEPVEPDFQVGDIINLKGPSVALDLQDKWFRVEAIDADGVKLSPPYVDAKCTVRYHPPPPGPAWESARIVALGPDRGAVKVDGSGDVHPFGPRDCCRDGTSFEHLALGDPVARRMSDGAISAPNSQRWTKDPDAPSS